MRLIDADALPHYTGYALSADEVAMAVENAPTIDAVQVVRCGECKYLMASGVCNMFADDNIKPSASDFCSYGERRNNEID